MAPGQEWAQHAKGIERLANLQSIEVEEDMCMWKYILLLKLGDEY